MKHIFVSPHFDDVALSCGGRIVREGSRTQDVLVLNIFSSDPADIHGGEESRLALFDSLNSERNLEDTAAWSEIGVRSLHANLPEALLRREFPFRFFKTGRDGAIVNDVAKLLRDVVASNPQATFYFPAGIGNHVDHLACRSAAFRLLDEGHLERITLYEDIPYSWLKFLRTQHYRRLLEELELETQDHAQAMRPGGESLFRYVVGKEVPFPRGKKLFPAIYASLLLGDLLRKTPRATRSYIGKLRSITLDEVETERKKELVYQYKSQIPMLFGKNADRLLRDLRDCFSKEVTLEITKRV